MYYIEKIKDNIRVDPRLLNLPLEKAIYQTLKENYEGKIDSKEAKIYIAILDIESIGEGVIIPGDGGIYYDVTFKALSYSPKISEIVEGIVEKNEEFGSFVRIGPIIGLVHKTQLMDDYVSFSSQGVFQGKTTKFTLKPGDEVRARIIAVSTKEGRDIRVGLTMRQVGLGALDWLRKMKEEKEKAKKKKEK